MSVVELVGEKLNYSDDDKRRSVRYLRPIVGAAGAEPDRGLIFDVLWFINEDEWTGPSKDGSHWPVYERTIDERSDDAKQRLIDWLAGDLVDGRQRAIPAPDVTTAECLQRFFRGSLVGEHQDRDWKIVNYLAKKEIAVGAQQQQSGSLRAAANKFGVHKSTIAKVRDKQISAIWVAVKKAMPSPDTAAVATGRVWGEKIAA